MAIETTSNLFRPYEVLTNIIPGSMLLLFFLYCVPSYEIETVFSISVAGLVVLGVVAYFVGVLLRMLSGSLFYMIRSEFWEFRFDRFGPEELVDNLIQICESEFQINFPYEDDPWSYHKQMTIVLPLIHARTESNFTTRTWRRRMLRDFHQSMMLTMWVIAIFLIFTAISRWVGILSLSPNVAGHLIWGSSILLPIIVSIFAILMGFLFYIWTRRYSLMYYRSVLLEFYANHVEKHNLDIRNLDDF